MAELPWLTALYPQRYLRGWSLPRGAIRVFGDGWAFSVIPETMDFEPYGPSDIVFKAGKFATPDKTSTSADWHQRNVFALDYGQEVFERQIFDPPRAHFYRYNPVNHGTAAGGLSTQLVARFILNPKGWPLYQLLQGRIEVPQESSRPAEAGRERLLDALLDQCGIEKAAGTRQRSIFLYPDGMCLFGRIAVPGQATELDGWFKISTRAMAVQTVSTKELGRGLSLCLDPSLPGNDGPSGHIAQWRSAFETLRSALSASAFAKAQWLSAPRMGTAGVEALFWPGSGSNDEPDYFRRRKDAALHIDGGIARLQLCPDGLMAGPNRLEVRGDARELKFRSVADSNSHAEKCPSLHYRYERGVSEGIDVAGNRADKAKPCDGNARAVKLTIPLIESAQQLRRESGMPTGGEAGLDVVRPIWTFTQLDQGMLHWPFPDATAEALSALLEDAPEGGSIGVPTNRPDDPVGAILLGNRPDREGFRDDLRPWTVAITECRDLALALKMVKVDGAFILDEADIWLGEHEMVLEGAMQVIPFRQTVDRLLPDHDERAMRTTSLRAVTPGLLQGLEQAAHQKLSKEVGAVLEIENLRLSPTDGVSSGRVFSRVTLPCRAPESTERSAEEEAALRPWIWTCFDKLPTVQTHALAQAGVALAQPTGLRQLAPFRRMKGRRDLNYVFEGALDPSRLAPGLRLDPQDGEGGTYASPEIDSRYADEIGMAILTMPSVTLFPGRRNFNEKAMPDRLPELPSSKPSQWIWPLGNQKLPFLVEMRQDIALSDSLYAQATVGPDPADAESGVPAAVPPQDRFEPIATNGPQAWSSSGEVHSWKRLWAFRNRQAALAAVEPRALITRTGNLRQLANLLPQGPLDIRLTLRLERVGDNIGEVKILSVDGKTTISTMSGLPAAGDLEGMTAVINGVSVDHGTAKLVLDSGSNSFIDQRSLASSGVSRKGKILSRQIGAVTLISCAEPLDAETLSGNPPIKFWFSDVPKTMEGVVAALANKDLAHNHQQGYRWAVSQKETLSTNLGLGGCLEFVPLSLAGAAEAGEHVSVKLTGFLEVWSGGNAVPQRADDAAASLELATDASPALEVGADVVVRLTDPGVTGTVPVILKITPLSRKAVLYVEVLGRSLALALEAVDPLPGTPGDAVEVLPLKFKGRAAPSNDKLNLVAIEVDLSGAAGPKSVLTYAFKFEAGGGTLSGVFTIDAISGMVELTEKKFSLSGLAIEPSVLLRLTSDCLYLTWRKQGTKDKVGAGLFKGAMATAHSGHVAAVLDPQLKVSDFEFEFDIHLNTTLDGTVVRLVLNGRKRGLFLSGSANVTTPYPMELAWRGERLQVQDIAARSAIVATHVVHHPSAVDPSTTLVLPQYVALTQDIAGLSARCDTVAVCVASSSTTWLVQLRSGQLTGVQLASLTSGQRVRALARLSLALAAPDGWATHFLPNGGHPIVRDLALGAIPRDWDVDEAYGLSPAVVSQLEQAPHYSDVLALFAAAQAGALMSAPQHPPHALPIAEFRLLAPDSNGSKLIEIGRFGAGIVPNMVEDDALRQWALGIVVESATWARGALLQISRADGLPPRNLVIDRDSAADESQSHKLAVRSRPQPSVYIARADTPVVRDPRRINMPTGHGNQLGGFRPVHAQARKFVYGQRPGEEALLSVSAMERSWRLDRADDPNASAYSDDTEYWLQDRSDTSFRNASQSATSARLAAESAVAVPEMAGAGVLYPVAGDAPEEVKPPDRLSQFLIPERGITRDIAPRPGVPQVARLGLRSVFVSGGSDAKSAGAYAPEVPFHAITPRPSLIGVNDRIRCDEFKSGDAAEISLAPRFSLFGPRASPPPRIGSRPGLDRQPLAGDAVSVTLAYPQNGVIDHDWSGHLDFVLSDASKLDVQPIWVSIDINGRHLHLDLDQDQGLERINCFRATDVDAQPKQPGDQEGSAVRLKLEELFRRLTLSTRARFEVGFLVKPIDAAGPVRSIGRLAVMDLPVSPSATSRLEQPHYFRFEDPEYNDMIEKRFAVKKQNGMTIIADRDKVRADGCVILVAGDDVPDGWSPRLSLKVKAAGSKDPIKLTPPSPFGTKCWLIDCRRLVAQDTTLMRPRPELGDVLSVSIDALTSLPIEITEEEPFAKNPASFAVVQVLPEVDRVPLFASMSQPTMIELVDPADLLVGIARYRSSYEWLLFARGRVGKYRFQKIGGSGAMHLSKELKT